MRFRGWQIPPRERTQAAGASHTGALGNRNRRVGKVPDAKRAHHSVELAVVEWHRVDARFAKSAAGIQTAGELQHPWREINAGDESPTASSVHCDHAGSTGNVEQLRARTDPGCRQQRLCGVRGDRREERVVATCEPVVRVALKIAKSILIDVVRHGPPELVPDA
jgi:hypothetical protein